MPRAEVVVQLRAVAEALNAEVVVASLRRAVAAEVESPLRAAAAMVELSLHADGAEVELPLHEEVAFSREALKRCRTADCQHCYPWRYRCRWLFRLAGKRMIAGKSRSVAGAGFRIGSTGIRDAR